MSASRPDHNDDLIARLSSLGHEARPIYHAAATLLQGISDDDPQFAAHCLPYLRLERSERLSELLDEVGHHVSSTDGWPAVMFGPISTGSYPSWTHAAEDLYTGIIATMLPFFQTSNMPTGLLGLDEVRKHDLESQWANIGRVFRDELLLLPHKIAFRASQYKQAANEVCEEIRLAKRQLTGLPAEGAGNTKRRPRIDRAKANSRALKVLRRKPPGGKKFWSIRSLHDVIDCSTGLISGLPAWQDYAEQHNLKSNGARRTVSLTQKLLATLPDNAALNDLIAEQSSDYEPSPLDPRPRRIHTNKK